MKCPNCGAEIADNNTFCPACGQKLIAQNPAQGAQQPVQYATVPPAAQTIIIQQQQVPVTATPAEKEVLFSTTGSFWMLIASIVLTVNLLTALIGDILSLNIMGLVLYVLDILIVIGFWIAYANGRKKNLSSTGISLIRVPYIIQFVFSVISFVFNVLLWSFTLNILGLIFGIISFVFLCICFASVKKTLDMGRDIARNKTVMGRKAGLFAAVIMIISASITLITEIVDYITIQALAEALKDTPVAFLATLLGSGGIMSLVVAIVTFLANISAALVLIRFARKYKGITG